MSVDIATLGIKVDASEVNRADASLDKLADTGARAEKATDGLANGFGNLKTVIAGLGLGALIREAVQLADTYSNIQGRLSLVTSGTNELADVSEKLFQSAQRARVGYEATADLYASLARSTKTLGTSQTDLLQVTETINKALIVSGASAATANGALVQLSQGFASGTLRGDELNSVLEGTPRLAQAIADGMGVTVGQLRALGAEGKITGETVFNALKSQQQAVETEFAKMPTTVAQSFVVLENEILKYIGEANKANGATAAISGALGLLAGNLDKVVTVLEIVAVALTVRYVAGAVAATVASVRAEAAMLGMATSAEVAGVAVSTAGSKFLGFFGGPIGAAITGVVLGIGYFASESTRAGNVVDTVNKSYAEMEKRLAAGKVAAGEAADGSKNVGSSAAGAIPGVDGLTGSVKALAGQYYQAADAAKKARIEIASTALQQARTNERAAGELTPAGRNASTSQLSRGDFLGNASTIGRAAVGSLSSVLSGGRTDREATEAYRKAVAVSIQAQKDLTEAYRSTNSAASTATQANDVEIKKLTGQIADLKKLKSSATAEEAKKIDKRIATSERKVDLLKTGASEDAVNVATGGGGGGSGKSAVDTATKASKDYAEALRNETANIGQNEIAIKMAAAAREAAKAPTAQLRNAILAEADAWASATMLEAARAQSSKAVSEELEKSKRASEDQTKSAKDMAEAIDFENKLLGMNAEQRAVANAMRDLEMRGIKEGTVAYALYGEKILNAARAKGELEMQADNASKFADSMSKLNSNLQDAAESFSNLFGTAGEGFGELISVMGDYYEYQAEQEERLADLREKYSGSELLQKEADLREEAANQEMQTYGRVIHGVKNMFNQKSTAYKVMEGVEKAYAAVRLAMAIKEIVMETLVTTAKVGGAGARMATDAVETASSVSHSGIRAAADGVAAFAKTLASLPFPLNLIAGAAVLAALVGVGVAISGGGGHGGATAATTPEPAKPTDYANQDSPYSVLQTQPGYGGKTQGGGSFANDNSAPAANGNTSIRMGDITIHADGANSETVNQMQELLVQHQAETVDKARLAVRQDNIRNNGRQQIGGAI